MISPLAGKPAPASMLVNVPRLVTAYYSARPDPDVPAERVAFGTSGHRGSALTRSFNEAHILAITQAICEYRKAQTIDGPLFLGIDTHALSEPAFASALELLAGHGVDVMIDHARGYTPTPVISYAILRHNRGRTTGLADGIVITPSHNPPEDGGFKYNPPSGGPADVAITAEIENRANALLSGHASAGPRVPFERALHAATTHAHDLLTPYVNDLSSVVDIDAIRGAGVRLGVDPLGGAGLAYWQAIAERLRLPIEIVNDAIDPTFRFMTVDWDGRIRTDCSSPYAMVRLVGLKDRFDVAWGNDADHDRHGIVTPSAGLMNPNHFLAVAISYLFGANRKWPVSFRIGKTVVSSSMIDRVVAKAGRTLIETPVGFKWFVDGLLTADAGNAVGFAGEESAGASFRRLDGSPWTTDKDGIILGLLAAEITAKLRRDPGAVYTDLTREFGDPIYERIDAEANAAQRQRLVHLVPSDVRMTRLAGQPVRSVLTTAPGNG